MGLLIAAATACACGGSTLLVDGGAPKLEGPLRAITTTSNRPAFADALAARLGARGYSVLDAGASAAVVSAASGRNVAAGTIDPAQDPDALARLRALQVDLVMAVDVRMVVANLGFGRTRELLDAVNVTIYPTSTPGPAGGFHWKNSWGGMPGSPADALSRRSEPQAAEELAAVAAKLLGPPGPRVVVAPGAAVRERAKPAPPAPVESAAPSAAVPLAAAPPPPAAAQPVDPPAASSKPARPPTPAEAADLDAQLLP